MIAMTRGPLSVKDHSLRYAPVPPRYYNRFQRKRGAPYSPLLERPGFSLVLPGPPAAGLRELRPNAVPGSSISSVLWVIEVLILLDARMVPFF
jgi:hypothetical protein